MNKTKIEWCDMTWNPVTGCFNNCPYCYARKIAYRFGGASETINTQCGMECNWDTCGEAKNHELNESVYDPDRGRISPYPYDFDPTFHEYRLDQPSQIKKQQNIFVCSMADLFGDWVPDEWIEKVFDACIKATQHRYMFLTKNTKRYIELKKQTLLPNFKEFWYGTTITNNETPFVWNLPRYEEYNSFVSIEPIQSKIDVKWLCAVDWVIIGCETGNRKDKIIPKKEWIENIVNHCKEKNVPVFMKNNLAEEKWRKDKKTGEMILVEPKVWDEPLVQEFPWRGK